MKNGADVLEEIRKAVEGNGIEYGLFVSGCGKIRDVELVSSEPKGGMSRTKFAGECDLNAISGKVQKRRGSLDLNVRVSVCGRGFTPRAGQLVGGKAAEVLEIGIRNVDLNKIIGA